MCDVRKICIQVSTLLSVNYLGTLEFENEWSTDHLVICQVRRSVLDFLLSTINALALHESFNGAHIILGESFESTMTQHRL